MTSIFKGREIQSMNRDYPPLLRMTSIFKGLEIESMNIIDIGMDTMKYAQMTQFCADDFIFKSDRKVHSLRVKLSRWIHLRHVS